MLRRLLRRKKTRRNERLIVDVLTLLCMRTWLECIIDFPCSPHNSPRDDRVALILVSSVTLVCLLDHHEIRDRGADDALSDLHVVSQESHIHDRFFLAKEAGGDMAERTAIDDCIVDLVQNVPCLYAPSDGRRTSWDQGADEECTGAVCSEVDANAAEVLLGEGESVGSELLLACRLSVLVAPAVTAEHI